MRRLAAILIVLAGCGTTPSTNTTGGPEPSWGREPRRGDDPPPALRDRQPAHAPLAALPAPPPPAHATPAAVGTSTAPVARKAAPSSPPLSSAPPTSPDAVPAASAPREP